MVDEVLEIISREEAKARGLKKYFTGIPCWHGHVTERSISGNHCLGCRKIEHLNNREKAIAAAAKWNKNNPERAKRASAASRKRHAEKLRKISRDNYRKMKEEKGLEYARQVSRQVRERHRDKFRVHWRNRHARKRNAEGGHTAKDIENLRERQRGLCNGCSVVLNPQIEHVDHILALSKGGSNWPSNLQLLCKTCNLTKSDSSDEEWRAARGFEPNPFLCEAVSENPEKV